MNTRIADKEGTHTRRAAGTEKRHTTARLKERRQNGREGGDEARK